MNIFKQLDAVPDDLVVADYITIEKYYKSARPIKLITDPTPGIYCSDAVEELVLITEDYKIYITEWESEKFPARNGEIVKETETKIYTLKKDNFSIKEIVSIIEL